MPFNDAKNGYDKREVDVYIDTIRTEYSKAVGVNNWLNARIQELEQAVKAAPPASSAVDMAAIEAEALTKANGIIQQAEQNAARILQDAQQRADDIAASAAMPAQPVQEEVYAQQVPHAVPPQEPYQTAILQPQPIPFGMPQQDPYAGQPGLLHMPPHVCVAIVAKVA